VVVKVERRFTTRCSRKTVRRTKNYHGMTRSGAFKVGDSVTIEETVPISKLKRWRVVEVTAEA
jgi:small subunit ribosomal protein S17